jgi:uncharacterized protein YjdB
MRTFMLAVTGLAFSIAGCSSYGTSVVAVENTRAQVASVSVAIPQSLVAGQTARAVATPRDASGSPLADRPVTWSTSSASVASVTDSGMVSAVAPGTAVVSAVSEGVAGQASMAVVPPAPTPVASVDVSPTTATLQVGTTQQLSAVTRDANNNVLTGRAISWTSVNTGIATVSGSGLVRGVAAGNVSITASSEGQIGSSAITVSAAAPVPVASVTVSPSSASLQVGGTQQLSAVTRDANNNVLTGRVVTWSSANPAIASVNSSGIVSAVSAGGPIQITATSETKTGTSAITVTAPLPPPPPGGGAGWRGKEPAGMTLITDQPFTSLPSNGWTGFFGYDLASDATGPQSPGGAFENIYPAGMAGGGNPGLAEFQFSGRKTLYVAMYVKHSANFQGHFTEVNKILHIWVGGTNHLVLNAAGSGSGALRGQIRLQGIAGGGNFDGGTAGVYDNGVSLARGAWHLLELIAVANTGSNKDGSVSLYVDGVLAATCSGIEFEANGPSWNLVKIDPTWGGTGDRVTSAMSLRVDHIYMSGK